MRFLIILAFSFMLAVGALAQSTRDAGTNPPPPVYQSGKSKTGFFQRLFGPKSTPNKKIESTELFEERMKAVAKQKEKEAKMAEKPEYSDKLYFGHKRPPKRRKPGKKKYCKICEFAH